MMVIITNNLPTSVILCKESVTLIFCKKNHTTIQQNDVSIKLKSHQAAKVLSVVLAVLMDKTNSAPSVHQSSEKNVLVLWNFLFKNQVIAPADQLNSHQTEIKRWR